jgi:putative heme-binding domain-containing protein
MTRSRRDDRDVADVATGVPSAAAARFLLGHIRSRALSRTRLVEFVHHIARYGDGATEPELTAFIAAWRDEGLAQQAALLKAVQQGLQERGGAPGTRVRDLALDVARTLLDSSQGDEVKAGIQLTGAFAIRDLQARLAALAGDRSADEATRSSALSTLSTLAPRDALPVLGKILGDPSDSIALRERAAAALGTSAQPGAEAGLLAALPTAPGRLQTGIAAGLALRPTGARALLDAVAAGKASARVLQDPRVAAALNQAKLPDLRERLDPLLKGLPASDQSLRDLIASRRARFETSRHNPAEGARVFEKNCMACHQLRGQGARIAPQLDGIGLRGVDRLLEDILDPNRNVDQAFRTTQLALADGRLVAGLLLREEGEVLVLADSQGKEVRVDREQVEERVHSQLSPMPANFADQVTEADLYDLLAYLLTSQPPQVEKPSGDR